MSSQSIIALITDYGIRDTYVAQVKGVILSYRRDVVIIDVTHEVEPFNEVEAAFLLTTYVPYMPPKTIHLCIVDPKVGGERRPIVIETNRGDYFIGPDTGFMIPAAEILGIVNVYEIDESKLGRRFSETFHGRDVFAHIVGKLSTGVDLDEIGKPISDYKRVEIPKPVFKEDIIESTVLHVDRYGNVITNLKFGEFEISFGDILELHILNEVVRCPLVQYYSKVDEGSFLTTVGGSGYIEVSINKGNASQRLGLKPGDKLRIRLIKNI
ncbi:MAG: SAM-dependent chlorinase/fluorinase [Aigarchaeota archaeon]|nr:SAM-dependent chlorinase/fluorinase [Aigarchaeota archaeon]MCX8193431.1 SAM-dependent chlorinase/fluorinase [Nitrososphaeria archaeon]MDW7985837.1 SAM-dependent chlorinase/fluorinase [Nitrososphaerota archaeon]